MIMPKAQNSERCTPEKHHRGKQAPPNEQSALELATPHAYKVQHSVHDQGWANCNQCMHAQAKVVYVKQEMGGGINVGMTTEVKEGHEQPKGK